MIIFFWIFVKFYSTESFRIWTLKFHLPKIDKNGNDSGKTPLRSNWNRIVFNSESQFEVIFDWVLIEKLHPHRKCTDVVVGWVVQLDALHQMHRNTKMCETYWFCVCLFLVFVPVTSSFERSIPSRIQSMKYANKRICAIAALFISHNIKLIL